MMHTPCAVARPPLAVSAVASQAARHALSPIDAKLTMLLQRPDGAMGELAVRVSYSARAGMEGSPWL